MYVGVVDSDGQVHDKIHLPKPVCLYMISKLELRDVKKLAQTSKSLQRLCQTPSVWNKPPCMSYRGLDARIRLCVLQPRISLKELEDDPHRLPKYMREYGFVILAMEDHSSVVIEQARSSFKELATLRGREFNGKNGFVSDSRKQLLQMDLAWVLRKPNREFEPYFRLMHLLSLMMLDILLSASGMPCNNLKVSKEQVMKSLCRPKIEQSYMRLIRYAANTQASKDVGAHNHTDASILTLIPMNTEAPGLKLGECSNVPIEQMCRKNDVLVIPGRTLDKMTGQFFPSMCHSVHPPFISRDSMPFFLMGEEDTVVDQYGSRAVRFVQNEFSKQFNFLTDTVKYKQKEEEKEKGGGILQALSSLFTRNTVPPDNLMMEPIYHDPNADLAAMPFQGNSIYP